MADEIQFFGLKPDIKISNPKIKESLNNFGIYYPATVVLSIDNAKGLDSNSLPWPVRVDLSNGGLPTKIVNSWPEFSEILDEVRDPDSSVFLRLLPPANNNSDYKSLFAYLSRDYICIHDTNSDIGFVLNVCNDELYQDISNDLVFRLVHGHHGWFYDSTFDYVDSRIQPITHYRLSDIENFFDNFYLGYKAGFDFSNSTAINLNIFLNYRSEKSYIGDFYSFGYFLGSLIRNKVSEVIGNGEINKSALLLAKLSASDNIYQDTMSLAELHNKIVSKSTDGLVSAIVNFFDKIGYHTNIAVKELCTYASKYLVEIAKSIGKEYSCEPFTIPDGKTSDVVTTLISDKSQFRVTSKDHNGISIRLQLSNCELINTVSCGQEKYTVMAWKNMSNTELDLTVKSSHLGISNDSEWNSWVSKIEGQDFSKQSNYSGSSAKYASISFSEQGFCLEDGTIVIPKHKFLKKLSQNYSIKISL